MSNDKENDNRNASSSWSGYNHQGKVGIFLGLKHLFELIDTDKDYTSHYLEFEGAEDVDIKDGIEVISRHQIKAKKEATTPNAYKDVLNVYSKEENRKGFNIIGVDENSRYLHTIREVKGIVSSKNEFEELKANREIASNTKYVENKSKVQLYEYPNKKKYCDLSKIYQGTLERYSRSKIKKILEKRNHSMAANERFIESKLNIIKELLVEKIREAHSLGGTATPKLTLVEFYDEILSTEEVKEESVYRAKAYFEIYWNRFVEYDDINELNDDKLSAILNMQIDDFKSLIVDLNPGKIVEEIDPASLMDETALEEIFFEFLNQINNKYIDLDELICTTRSTYRLSLINNKPGKVGEVVNRIIENENMLKRVFDSDYLINGRINKVQLINDYIGDIPQDYDAESNPNYVRLPINNIFKANSEFITIEKAIDNIKDELNV